MPNAKDFNDDRRRVLAVGIGGCGKTTCIRTLPGKKFCYVFEMNSLQSLKGADVDYELFLREPNPDLGSAKHPGKGLPSAEPFENFLEHTRQPDEFFEQYDWICFDSMTSFIDIVGDYVCNLAQVQFMVPFSVQKDKGNLYVDAQIQIMNVFAGFARMPQNLYVTAHTQFKQEGESGPMKNLLLFIGQHQTRLPILFTDIWRFFAEPDKQGKPHFYIQTGPDRQSDYIRNTMHNLEFQEEMTIEDWSNPEQFGFGRLLKYHSGELK